MMKIGCPRPGREEAKLNCRSPVLPARAPGRARCPESSPVKPLTSARTALRGLPGSGRPSVTFGSGCLPRSPLAPCPEVWRPSDVPGHFQSSNGHSLPDAQVTDCSRPSSIASSQRKSSCMYISFRDATDHAWASVSADQWAERVNHHGRGAEQPSANRCVSLRRAVWLP